MQNDPMANALSVVLNAERLGKKTCLIKPVSKQVETVFGILKGEGYIGELRTLPDGRGSVFEVELAGMINKCGAIKPRFAVQKTEFERFEKQFLPAKDFGVLIVSTSKGVMTHRKAKEAGVGGKLVAYCY